MEPGCTQREEPLRISAVVPALEEAAGIEGTLESLRSGGVSEIIVVDGGSADGTHGLASALADRVALERGGLRAQLNHGARLAGGDVLLFHYADVRFPAGGARDIRAALRERQVAGGAFRLRFASRRLRFRVVEQLANARNRLGLGPFGDQSLFVRADVFRQLGGFPAGAFFEDLALVRLVRRRGRFRLLRERVDVSVRRWERLGFCRAVLLHLGVYVRYFLARGRRSSATRRAHALRTVR